MFDRALRAGEARAHEAVVLTLTADLLRRAGRFDEALERCDRVTTILMETDDEKFDNTANIVAFIRCAADYCDDTSHHMGEVFAGGE